VTEETEMTQNAETKLLAAAKRGKRKLRQHQRKANPFEKVWTAAAQAAPPVVFNDDRVG
jgi:hypothetical protein